MDAQSEVDETVQHATLGGGCFWCLEAVYLRVTGVRSVISGYAGGSYPDPTYNEVCSGRTGHAEVVRITFDPDEVSFRDLLRIFFTIHDPTTPDRQGADRGPQYRSIILHESDEQEKVAREVIREIDDAGLHENPVVTELAPLDTFYPAEIEHEEYYDRNPRAPYCQAVIAPKVRKARAELSHLMRPQG
ncbi:MAG: peptide-methionine (S)-S-oxide reductase [Gemmatimonadales bacterium]|nr:MAG: peptide-methionine (S)-S-oxide reductase [Gemmatimonadales bacterium]